MTNLLESERLIVRNWIPEQGDKADKGITNN
jgi:hypothetical protein